MIYDYLIVCKTEQDYDLYLDIARENVTNQKICKPLYGDVYFVQEAELEYDNERDLLVYICGEYTLQNIKARKIEFVGDFCEKEEFDITFRYRYDTEKSEYCLGLDGCFDGCKYYKECHPAISS